jgi:DNA-binding protein Fis
MRRYEIEIIQSALKYTGGNQRAAARLLGLKATTLNAKIKHYDMQRSYSHIYRARQ